MTNKIELGTIAVVTTTTGKQYVGIWSLAPGIEEYWYPVLRRDRGMHHLFEGTASYGVIGRKL